MKTPDDQPNSVPRAVKAPEFWLLLAAAAVASFGVSSLIVFPTTAVGLLISSLPKYLPLEGRAREAGASRVFWATLAASLVNALVASGGAFLAGRLIGWLWGF